MANTLKGKKIVLGITGSIAAYKACYIIRGLIKQGAEVQVVITPAGKEFITPITLSALTSKPVISEFFAQRDGTWNSHVDLGLWADAMLIAPATASTIGKMANGVADNMLITTYLSAKAPVFVAPAMDLDMYAHPSTQKNLDTLRSYGNHIIEPGTGELASHLIGKGRMEEPEVIIQHLANYFAGKEGDLRGKTIMITAGPTYEKIDPVRFIGNYSSGKMGFAIADECAARGAKVIMISGPVQQQLKYPVRFVGKERRVYLSGEAYFEVQRDTTKPFIVVMNGNEVRVLGTEFNVRSYKDEKCQFTTLVTGKVLLTTSDRKCMELLPNEQGIVDPQGDIRKEQVDVALYTAWKDGNFVFRKQSLEHIMEIVERWYDLKVIFEDEWCKQVSFSGNVERYDDFSKLAEMLEATGSVKFRIKNNEIYVTKR